MPAKPAALLNPPTARPGAKRRAKPSTAQALRGQYQQRVILDAPVEMSVKDKREIASLVKLMRLPA
jgi:hypothetical protein